MRLTGKKVIALVDEEFEDLELWYPLHRVREEGAEVHLAGRKRKTYIGKYGVPAEAEYSFDELEQFRLRWHSRARRLGAGQASSLSQSTGACKGNECRPETDWTDLSCGLGADFCQNSGRSYSNLYTRHSG